MWGEERRSRDRKKRSTKEGGLCPLLCGGLLESLGIKEKQKPIVKEKHIKIKPPRRFYYSSFVDEY